jgi:nucleotide-binding universal stress UspA family protein
MTPFVVTSILATTDLSDSSLPALRYARLFADRFFAKLTVMYTDPIVYPIDYVGPAAGLYVDTSPEHHAALRTELVQHAAEAMNGRPYEVVVTLGQPIPTILSAAREQNADLIITGTHLRHGWRRAILGSVSEGVLHGSHCPVLTVAVRDHPNAAPAVHHVVCPVNFTDVAHESLHVAARIAEAFSAKLTAVHVIESDEGNAEAAEARIRSWIGAGLEDICEVRHLVVRGGAAERVLDSADDLGADFFVVGAQHRMFRDATVIGTTTERLIRFASSPVLVVPRPNVDRNIRTHAREMAGTR